MSYDIHLLDPVSKEVIQLDRPHEMKGGTYQLSSVREMSGGTYHFAGTREAWLNITYNYSPHFDKIGDKGIRSIYGKTGAESIPLLKTAIESLGDDVNPDYWKPTEGNAKAALLQLVALAQMRPDGIWEGD